MKLPGTGLPMQMNLLFSLSLSLEARPCPHEISHQLSPLVKNLWKTHRPHLIPVIPLLRTQKPLLVPLKQYHPPFQSQLDGQPPEEQPTGKKGSSGREADALGLTFLL